MQLTGIKTINAGHLQIGDMIIQPNRSRLHPPAIVLGVHVNTIHSTIQTLLTNGTITCWCFFTDSVLEIVRD